MSELVKVAQTWQNEDGSKTEKTFEYEGGNLIRSSEQAVGVVLDQQLDDGLLSKVARAAGLPVNNRGIVVEAVERKGPLPADFPGHKALDEAGVHTYHQLAKYVDDYTAIPGIGKATAEKIAEALATE